MVRLAAANADVRCLEHTSGLFTLTEVSTVAYQFRREGEWRRPSSTCLTDTYGMKSVPNSPPAHWPSNAPSSGTWTTWTGGFGGMWGRKERLIGLLEEEKQAIINQAVTRGLDPSVRLKPSGVEWLGDVPEHWESMRLRRPTVGDATDHYRMRTYSPHRCETLIEDSRS